MARSHHKRKPAAVLKSFTCQIFIWKQLSCGFAEQSFQVTFCLSIFIISQIFLSDTLGFQGAKNKEFEMRYFHRG